MADFDDPRTIIPTRGCGAGGNYSWEVYFDKDSTNTLSLLFFIIEEGKGVYGDKFLSIENAPNNMKTMWTLRITTKDEVAGRWINSLIEEEWGDWFARG